MFDKLIMLFKIWIFFRSQTNIHTYICIILMLIFFSPLFRYILGVESPLVCDILHTADENGIMKVTSKADFETAKTFSSDKKINEEKVVSEKEYIKFTLDDAITDDSKVKEKEPVVDDDEIYDSIITKAKENEEDEDPEDYDYIDDEDE